MSTILVAGPGARISLHPALIVLLCAALARPAPAQSTKLSGPLAGPGSDVVWFDVDPDGTHAFYVADQDTLGVFGTATSPG